MTFKHKFGSVIGIGHDIEESGKDIYFVMLESGRIVEDYAHCFQLIRKE